MICLAALSNALPAASALLSAVNIATVIAPTPPTIAPTAAPTPAVTTAKGPPISPSAVPTAAPTAAPAAAPPAPAPTTDSVSAPPLPTPKSCKPSDATPSFPNIPPTVNAWSVRSRVKDASNDLSKFLSTFSIELLRFFIAAGVTVLSALNLSSIPVASLTALPISLNALNSTCLAAPTNAPLINIPPATIAPATGPSNAAVAKPALAAPPAASNPPATAPPAPPVFWKPSMLVPSIFSFSPNTELEIAPEIAPTMGPAIRDVTRPGIPVRPLANNPFILLTLNAFKREPLVWPSPTFKAFIGLIPDLSNLPALFAPSPRAEKAFLGAPLTPSISLPKKSIACEAAEFPLTICLRPGRNLLTTGPSIFNDSLA